MNQGRLIGIILISIAFGVAVITSLFIAVQTSAGELVPGGAVILAGIAFVPIALLAGFGIYIYVQGEHEADEESIIRKQRRLLDILNSKGQVSVTNMALELDASVDHIQDLIYQLVGLQVFSGYINWEDGVLYSSEAHKLHDLKQCERCGAPISLVGKGVIECSACGTEYFLPQ